MELEDPIGKRRRPRQGRSQASVDAILEAAAQLFVEHGPHKVTTNHIAERAGVSIGTLYQYFTDRDAIVRGLLDTRRMLVFSRLAKGLEGAENEALPELIRRVVPSLAEAIQDRPALQRVLNAEMMKLRTYEEIMSIEDGLTDALLVFLASRPDEVAPMAHPYSTVWLAVHTASSAALAAVSSDVLEAKLDQPAVSDALVDVIIGLLCSKPEQPAGIDAKTNAEQG
jgi:AcrR family transcriptional regulator